MRGSRESIFYLSVGIGMAISTSVFTMLSGLFKLTDPGWVIGAIAVAGAICMLIAAAIGELASMYPSAPGIRTYLKAALGDRWSLLFVYMYLLFVILVAGVEAAVFSYVVHFVLPWAQPTWVVVAMMAFVVAVNLTGFELSGNLQILTTFAIVALIVGGGVLGMATSDDLSAPFAQRLSFAENAAQLPATAAMAMFLFMGFEWITPVGYRPDAYRRKIPLSMLGAIAGLGLTYACFAAGMAARLDPAQIASDPTPQVAYFRALLGPAGGWWALALSAGAICSTFNAGVMGGSRLIKGLAQERCLPDWCSFTSLTTAAPIGAIGLLGSLSLGSGLVVTLNGLEGVVATVGAALICAVYAAFLLAMLRLRAKQPNTRRPFTAPVPAAALWLLVLVLPAMGISAVVSLPELSGVALATLAACLVAAAIGAELSLARKAKGSAPAPASVRVS